MVITIIIISLVFKSVSLPYYGKHKIIQNNYIMVIILTTRFIKDNS